MKTTSTNTYRNNRDKFTLDQLRLYDGKWVAFSTDGKQVVASAPSIAELASELRRAQIELHQAVLEHIEIDSAEIQLGAAELS